VDSEKIKQLNRTQLGRGLKGLRLLNNHTLEDLGFYLSKDVGYLSRIENGKMSMKFDTLSEILCFYDLSVKEFYDQLDDLI
jgi:transcriptional regulator with XRE-family HTH domain